MHLHPRNSRQGWSERLFTAWFSGLVYNQIWEDPVVDATALQLDEHSRILTIASGGCNVLNYLLHSPERIVAIDVNSCHMALTRLKLTAVECLEQHAEFYDLFGFGNKKSNLDVYARSIEARLDESTRAFWDGKDWPVYGLGRRRIEYFTRGLYRSAKLGGFLGFIHLLCRLGDRAPNAMFRAKNLAEQEQIFKDVFDSFFDSNIVQLLGRIPATVYSLGIPPQQHKIMTEESGGNIVETFRRRVRKLACGSPLDQNYFAWQAFSRSYDHAKRAAVPDYLREENYSRLRANIHRVETHVTSLLEYLTRQEAGALNRFVLLDSQDWMTPEAIARLWAEIARVGGPDSRVIFRTAGEQSPVEQALPSELLRRFDCERELARELHEKDRSAVYGMFHVYSLRH